MNSFLFTAGVSPPPRRSKTRELRNVCARQAKLWVKKLELDQKDAIEFMELGVPSEIEKLGEVKDSWERTNRRNVNLLDAVCRLNDVVG